MITPYNVLRHELIGLRTKVIGKKHKAYGCEGLIVDETMRTLKIMVADRVKTVPKDSIALELDLPKGCRVRVDGSLLLGRPEERIKKKIRIKFV